jgi:menaquinone-specific isochorismate synthase
MSIARNAEHEGLSRIEEDRLRIVALRVPRRPLEVILAAATGEVVLWDPPDGPSVVGIGTAWSVRASGPDRFATVRRRAAELWERVQVTADGDALEPRLLGGFAFSEGAADEGPWSQFGDAWFVLPRWTYFLTDREAWLLVALNGHEASTGARFQRLVEAMAADAVVESGGRALRVSERAGDGPEAWTDQVADIVSAIRNREVAKVVLARRATVAFDREPDLAGIAARLVGSGRTATRFVMRPGGAGTPAFVGATPELLVGLRGRRLWTEALAGTASVGEGDALVASAKDLAEHAFVVDELRAALEPLTEHVVAAARPEVRRLRDLVHLATPIEARLTEGAHVLDVVAALHPTPAVGGVPRRAALDWIAEREVHPRGWYAAPIGWFDARGDGAFRVALRSALIDGRRAHLYAGAGIVEASEPLAEYRETELKLRTVLAAFEAAG